MKFPTHKCETSPCRTLTFRALFQTLSFFAYSFPPTGAFAVQCTVASTSSTGSWIRTFRRGVCRGVRSTAGDGLVRRFSNPLLILTRWCGRVPYLFEPFCWQTLGCGCWYTCAVASGISNHIHILTPGGCICRTWSSARPSSSYLSIPMVQSLISHHSSASLRILLWAVSYLQRYAYRIGRCCRPSAAC